MNKIIKLPIWQEPKNIEEARIQIWNLGKNLHEHAYLVGKYLNWVQVKLKNKAIFEAWVSENVWFGIRTARRFMAYAKKCDHVKTMLEYHPYKQLPSGDIMSPISGEYKTIIIDPPWPIQKIERYEAPYQEPNLDYETMSIDAIKAIKLPPANDSHLFLWTTQKYLPVSFEILEIWGFKYVLTMVWHKTGGFQPFGLPQYNCEFALYARKGSPKFVDTSNFFCCFTGKRRQHSRKPKEFYDLIRRVTPEPRIDIFNRGKIEGFDQYGDETNRF